MSVTDTFNTSNGCPFNLEKFVGVLFDSWFMLPVACCYDPLLTECDREDNMRLDFEEGGP